MQIETTDFAQAKQWAQELYGLPNFLQFWFPEDSFMHADRGDSWMSATRADKGAIYGMAIGSDAEPCDDWTHFSISRFADQSLIDTSIYKQDGEWDAFAIKTDSFAHLPALEDFKADLALVADFLNTHFPDASTKTDSTEVVAWTGLRDSVGNLVAIGALTLWESGYLAAQSICVDSGARGQGFGRMIVEGMIATAHHLGYKELCLGVWYHNLVAKRLYENIGFQRIDSFLHYSEIDDAIRRRNKPSSK